MRYAGVMKRNFNLKKLTLPAAVALISLGMACNRAPVPPVPGPTAANNTQNFYTVVLQIGTQQLLVQIAKTNAEREQGLSGRNALSDNQGMLFDFSDTPGGTPGFWMKDMKFDLDFIWINQGKVIGITPNVSAPKSPNDILKTYYPPSPVDEVLEVNSGWAKLHNIKVGDVVILK